VTFRFKVMSQEDAETIALWHYPEPFSFYDWAADQDDLAELLDSEARGEAYAAVEDEAGALVARASGPLRRAPHRRALQRRGAENAG
jgi:hypothetical protein